MRSDAGLVDRLPVLDDAVQRQRVSSTPKKVQVDSLLNERLADNDEVFDSRLKSSLLGFEGIVGGDVSGRSTIKVGGL